MPECAKYVELAQERGSCPERALALHLSQISQRIDPCALVCLSAYPQVPVEVTIRLLLAAIEADGGSRFLIDGFPRNTNNLSGWQQTVGTKLTLAGVLMYDVAESVLEERLLERGKTSGRSDDNIESIKKRFVMFKSESMPVIEYYRHQGLVSTFHGAKSVDEVWDETKAAIDAAEVKLSAA